MISWTDEVAAGQRQQEMLNTALQDYDVAKMLEVDKKKPTFINRKLSSLGETLIIVGVRLQLLNRQMSTERKSGE